MRRQAEICKLSRQYGVEELLPPSRKSSLWKKEREMVRAEKGGVWAAKGRKVKEGEEGGGLGGLVKMRRMVEPKGKGWERGLHAKWVGNFPMRCALRSDANGLGAQVGEEEEGNGGDAGVDRKVEEDGAWEGMEGLAKGIVWYAETIYQFNAGKGYGDWRKHGGNWWDWGVCWELGGYGGNWIGYDVCISWGSTNKRWRSSHRIWVHYDANCCFVL